MTFSEQACWIWGGQSASRDQSKGKEGKLFGLSVLETVKLRNGFVTDTESLHEVLKKKFTKQLHVVSDVMDYSSAVEAVFMDY
jgi:hypothetical protein